MKFIASAALLLLLNGCYAVPVGPPPPRVAYAPPPVVYAQPAPPVYYDTPAYYAYPAYGGYYGPNVNLDFGFHSGGRGRRW